MKSPKNYLDNYQKLLKNYQVYYQELERISLFVWKQNGLSYGKNFVERMERKSLKIKGIKNYLFILEQLELIKIVKFYEGKTPKMRLVNFSTELPKRKNYLNN